MPPMLLQVGKKGYLRASGADRPGNFRLAFAIRSQFDSAFQNGDARSLYVGRDVGNPSNFASLKTNGFVSTLNVGR